MADKDPDDQAKTPPDSGEAEVPLVEETAQFRDPLDELAFFLRGATSFGLYPLIAYSVGDDEISEDIIEADEEAAESETEIETEITPELTSEPEVAAQTVRVLTTSIKDLAHGISVLERATSQGYNLGKRLWPRQLLRLRDENPHVFFLQEHSIPGLSGYHPRKVGRLIARYGAPFLKEKGFGLVDICGFSRLEYAEQLSALYSLKICWTLRYIVLGRSAEACEPRRNSDGLPPGTVTIFGTRGSAALLTCLR